jgi:hypothetical protein
MDIQKILNELPEHHIPQPEVWQIDERTVDLNWTSHGVFCTFEGDTFIFTKVHPSGDIDRGIYLELPRTDLETIMSTFLTHWKAWRYTVKWGRFGESPPESSATTSFTKGCANSFTSRLCDAIPGTLDGGACPSRPLSYTCT